MHVTNLQGTGKEGSSRAKERDGQGRGREDYRTTGMAGGYKETGPLNVIGYAGLVLWARQARHSVDTRQDHTVRIWYEPLSCISRYQHHQTRQSDI